MKDKGDVSLPQTKQNQLLIYQKYVDLIEYAYNLLRKFPKSEKFAMAAHIKDSMYTVLKYILRANKVYNKILNQFTFTK